MFKMKMAKAYLAIKFHEDFKNKILIEEISNSLNDAGFQTIVMARDYEKYGKVHFSPKELMELTFELISRSDILVIEFSEKGVGLGIEAGYAYAKRIPIIVIAREGSDVSDTLKGISKEVIIYKNLRELSEKLRIVIKK